MMEDWGEVSAVLVDSWETEVEVDAETDSC